MVGRTHELTCYFLMVLTSERRCEGGCGVGQCGRGGVAVAWEVAGSGYRWMLWWSAALVRAGHRGKLSSR